MAAIKMELKQILGGCLFIFLFIFPVIHCLEVNVDFDDPRFKAMLNKCINSTNHKKYPPGPEDNLHQQCSPWKNKSCCIESTTRDIHDKTKKMYNFDWNHCSQIKPLSDKCRKHFVQDLCFYECSPNVGPWTVTVKNKFRSERFYKVPLCASECQLWFDDCAEDYTCTDNWTRNMEWVSGLGNKCPTNSSCATFKEIYQNPKYFCESVWDHSWEVVEDSEKCMKLWFNATEKNPNEEVAYWKAIQIMKSLKANKATGILPSAAFSVLSLLIVLNFN